MKRKIILGVSLFLMLLTLFALSINAAETIETWDISATSSDNVTATLYDDYSLVISGTGAMQDWTSSFAPWYSSYRDKIKSITIEEGVANISNAAFYNYDALTSVVIGDSVTTIGSQAFDNCSALTNVVIGDSVTTIGPNAFSYCTSLTSIVIPDSVTTIRYYAFLNCESLTGVVIPDSVTSIDYSVFRGCTALTSVIIGNSVATIGSGVFSSCTVLANIMVSEKNEYYCSVDGNLYTKDLKTLVQYATGKKDTSFTIPQGVETIDDSAFRGCPALTSVEIGDSVITISDRAFADCESLTNVVIGNSVTTIGDGVFKGCSLTSIELPDSVITIGYTAFYGCPYLTSIEVNENNMHYCSVDGNLYKKDLKTLVRYAMGKKDTSFEVPQGVESISSYAFYGCEALTSVKLPNSVECIYSSAFFQCYALTNIVIPNSVTYIRGGAFRGCSNLTIYTEAESQPSGWDSTWNSNRPVVWGHTHTYDFETDLCVCGAKNTYLAKWDISATENDSVYAYLYYGYSLIISGSGNMMDWTSSSNAPWWSYRFLIKSVTIENGITNVGEYAFSVCRVLNSVEIGNSVTKIGSYAFSNCNALASIIIPNSVTTIGGSAFFLCYTLKVYCEAESQPSGWDSTWNDSNRPVVWDYKNTIRGQVFTFKGYSFNEAGLMAVGFDIDYEAKALYEELTGETLEIGVVFAAYDLLLGNQPLDSQGNAVTLPDGAVVKFDLTEYDYTYYDFVITDIIDGIKDIPLVISAYINNGEENKYIQENGISDTVTGISYNEANSK